MKLAEALLRRKELQAKVDQLKAVKTADVFEMKMQRRQVSDTIDDITAQVPKLTASQVTEEYDFYAKRLRLIDAAIQQASQDEVDRIVNQAENFNADGSKKMNYLPIVIGGALVIYLISRKK